MFGSNYTEKVIVNSDWLEFAHENTRTICQHHALTCIQKEVLRAKNLIQQFLAGQPVERESLGILHIANDALKSILSEENEEEAYLLKMAKDFKDRAAQFSLGIQYRDQGDLEKAFYWLTLAAEGGMPVAQFNIGVLYRNQGDLEKALYWLTRAAEEGDPVAQFNVGILYRNQGDFEEALYWLTLAAENGNHMTKYGLDILLLLQEL